jgi:hypothetical protein
VSTYSSTNRITVPTPFFEMTFLTLISQAFCNTHTNILFTPLGMLPFCSTLVGIPLLYTLNLRLIIKVINEAPMNGLGLTYIH